MIGIEESYIPEESRDSLYYFDDGEMNSSLYCRLPDCSVFMFRRETQDWEEVLDPKHWAVIREDLSSRNYCSFREDQIDIPFDPTKRNTY